MEICESGILALAEKDRSCIIKTDAMIGNRIGRCPAGHRNGAVL